MKSTNFTSKTVTTLLCALILCSSDINTVDWLKKLLHWTIKNNHVRTTSLLLKMTKMPSPSDVNAEDEYGFTLLHYAAMNGNLGIAKKLIKIGAYINARDINSRTAIHYGVENEHLSIVKFFINSNVDINAKDKYGMTPLHEALQKGNLEMTQLLIDHGADINIKSNDGATSLHHATTVTSLHFYHATTNVNYEIAKLLIDMGVDVNAKDKYSITPLHNVALTGDPDIVQLLIDHDANVNARDQNNRVPLLYAVNAIIREQLLIDLKQVVISLGVETNTKDFTGKRLEEKRQLKTIQLLIENGADINTRNKDGLSAIDIAKKSGQKDVVKLLEEHVKKQSHSSSENNN